MQNQILTIGSLQLTDPLILAPMAGITDLPYRLLHKRFGAALVTTEMISAKGWIQQGQKTLDLLESRPEERPLAIQLFGEDPASLAEAAKLAVPYGELLDINMGCPVKKVVKGGAGSALLQDPGRIRNIIAAVRKATELPLTIKIRSGWDNASINFLEVGRIAEGEGADAITLHPRTRSQMFSGHSDWSYLAQLVKALKIPVIGSGDVFTAEDGMRMFAETGCAGIMIGRGGYGNPWLFRQLRQALSGQEPVATTLKERLQVALEHLQFSRQFLGERRAVLELRKHLCWYSRGLPGAGAFRASLQHLPDLSSLQQAITDYFASVEALENDE